MRKRSAVKRNVLFIRLSAIVLPAILSFALLSQTAFAKTYTITDGDRVVTYTTFATDPAAVLGEAGMELEEYDSYTTDGTSAITINRGQTIRVIYYGEEMDTTSGGETVQQLLTRLNLDVEAEDVLSHPADTATFDGMVLRIDKVLRRQETYTTTVAYDTVYCDDPSIPAGSEEVLTEGVDGELKCTAEVTYINGVEAKREVLSQTQTIAPVTRVVAQGTGHAVADADPYGMPIIGDGYIQLPTGEVLTYTKTDTVRATAYTHTDAGCDMITATGTTVRRGTVAVDPRFIPYGTRMFIVSNDGEYVYGLAVAEDCGGAIKRDRMDLYFPTYAECMDFGWRSCTIYFLG